MRNLSILTAILGAATVASIGCGATSSGEDQRKALRYQERSDEAGRNGQYGVAGEDQRKAQDAHYKAVTKAIDEGKPIPPQPQMGDRPPSPAPAPPSP
jgi:hypothetical protein